MTLSEWEGWVSLAMHFETVPESVARVTELRPYAPLYLCWVLDTCEFGHREVAGAFYGLDLPREKMLARMRGHQPGDVDRREEWWPAGDPRRAEFCWKMAEECDMEGVA